MPPDLVRSAYTRKWLLKAQKDLRRADIVLWASPPDPEDALFHCQQAIRKALKAFPTRHDQPFRKIHDLGKLGAQCISIDPIFSRPIRLTHRVCLGIPLSSRGGRAHVGRSDEVEEARELAREVAAAIVDRLPQEARP